MPHDRPVVLVSNRGPVSYSSGPDGELRGRRGAGGLVSGLAPVVEGTDTLWIAAAMSDDDRRAAAAGLAETDGIRARLLPIDPEVYRMAYEVVGNATLWFVHHSLFDLPHRPRFDAHFREAWDAYRAFNDAFADDVARHAGDGAIVLVQDFHLALLGPRLAERRPDLRTVHFSHTPFANPDELRVLPDPMARELLEGMAGHDACGFHTSRWADAFLACCREREVDPPRTFVSPLAPDADDLARVAAGAACAEALADLDAIVGTRAMIARVDRLELSKNVLRGFHAFDDLLERYPRWREQVVFAAFLNPSRQSLPEYQAYRAQVEALVARVNARWATPGWTPIVSRVADDHPRSIAALRRFDVLLVNPTRDGLNLVAHEGALVNERDGVVLLSPEAGAWDQLEGAVLPVHPYDIAGTADALAAALEMDRATRAAQAAELHRRASARTPADWLADQLAAAG